jgi:predicted Zn-dependent protease
MNPRSAEARSALAFLRAMNDEDLGDAERAGREAVEANPNSVSARLRYSQILYSNGKPQEAVREINAATALDPMSPVVHGHAGEMAFAMHNPAEAERHLRRAIELDSTAASPRIALAMVLSQQGRTEEALAMAESATRLRPNDPNMLGSYASLLGKAGRIDEATRIAERLAERAGEGRQLAGLMAQVYSAIGKSDEAAAWLRKGASDQRRYVTIVPPRFRYSFEQLRSDPRLAKMMDSLGYRIEFRRVTKDSTGAPPAPRPPAGQGSRSRSGDRR